MNHPHRTLALLAAMSCAASCFGGPAPKPNVILCMTDDQGWGDVSYNGLKQIRTPVLDSMAASGLRFNRFYAQQSCSPTRAIGEIERKLQLVAPGSEEEAQLRARQNELQREAEAMLPDPSEARFGPPTSNANWVPATAYHYCGIDAFNGILTSKSLWLSDAYYMNDYKEHRWVLDEASRQLEALGREEYRVFCTKVKRLINTLKVHPFVCCLSSEPDSLSQWRAYADDGAGFAIGFSGAALGMATHSFAKKHQITFTNVIYDAREQHDTRDRLIRKSLEGFAKHPDDELNSYSAFEALWKLASICKNPGFCEEKETRIVLMPDGTLAGGEVLGDKGISELAFRVSQNRLIPYFTFPFVPEAVVEVRLGPKNSERDSHYAVRMLLHKNGYNIDIIPIINSETTYR